MQVSGTNTFSHLQTNIQKPQELTQEQRDAVRETAVGIAGQKSTEAQIDAYTAGAQSGTSATNEVQNYTDFAANVRRAENLTILVENGDPSRLTDQPSVSPRTGQDRATETDQAQPSDSVDQAVQSAQSLTGSTDQTALNENINTYLENNRNFENIRDLASDQQTNQPDRIDITL